jgi:hypothetical protein
MRYYGKRKEGFKMRGGIKGRELKRIWLWLKGINNLGFQVNRAANKDFDSG